MKKPKIKHKPSAQQVELYNRVEFDFILGITNKNTKKIHSLLDPKGLFFGCLTKYRTLHFFDDQFMTLSANNIEFIDVKNHIALGLHLGKRCISFVLDNGDTFPIIQSSEDDILAFIIEVNMDSSLIESIHLVNHFTNAQEFNKHHKNN